MIVREFFRTREDGVNLYRTFSDRNVMIENEHGELYSEAVDVETATHTYTETDIPIPQDDPVEPEE